jgi:2-polyprenyl-6-methoxyphenol hydroxylase-like FAD-dependent oxidoreductase
MYLNRDGEVVDREDYAQWMTSWDLLYHLGRANFDGQKSAHVSEIWDQVLQSPDGDILKEAWGRAKYEYGRSVEDLRAVDDKVEVTWRDTRDGSDTAGQLTRMMADFVVCADGPSSRTRGMLLGEVAQRKYAGYVAFRGTVPESELEQATVFVEKFIFFHAQGTQILGYTIPGVDGTVEPGKRLVNWVWYWNIPEGTEEYEEVLTDSDGNHHRYTLPTGGKMRQDVWDRQKRTAAETLPPQFAELVQKTQKPFLQAITDVEPPARGTKIGRLLEGRAALLGDALAGFRPHTAASTSQAAFDASHLEQAFAGKISWDEYEQTVLEYATSWQKKGVRLGTMSQFGKINAASPLQMMAKD